MAVIGKNNVKIRGAGQQAIVFAHGFGCDQHMWRHVAPAFEQDYRTVLFDHVGAGQSDIAYYVPEQYGSLSQYARDVLAICDELALERPIFVGHSVSAMIGVLAAIAAPERFAKLVLVGPSPCYINDGTYVGGYSRADIDGLLDFLDDNFVAWSKALAPTIMGNPERPELGAELESSFCRTDPRAARQFARVTFLSDNRADLHKLHTPALIVQCSDDAIAPLAVGRYLAGTLAHSQFVQLAARGHCPNLSAPEELVACIRTYIESGTP